MFSLAIAAVLSSSPVHTLVRPEVRLPAIQTPLPAPMEVPDTGSWQVRRVTLDRTLVNDVLRIGGLTLQFIQAHGICPTGSTADCAYRVHYEFRSLLTERGMAGFTQQFAIVGANGVRTEGFCWFDARRLRIDPRRAALLYIRDGGQWLRMDVDGPQLEQLKDFMMMLAELHEPVGSGR